MINEIKNWISDKWRRFKKWIVFGVLGIGIVVAAPLVTIDPSTIDVSQIEQAFTISDIAQDYVIEGTTFTKPAKNENSIKIKIGKDDIDEFAPDFYISRWEDEVYFKMIPRDLDKVKKKDKEIKFENKKIKFETPDIDYHMYEIEDGYEYEVILKKKPNSNIITFDIETQGLDFYYQPELTQDEIDDGAFRPENVIGSYAVYHLTKKNHIIGQKNYMTGKVFHIYRPQMEDDNGWKVWGELNIEQGILSVTIPQDFIDNAVYPIYHATGLTFGWGDPGTPGGSSVNTNDVLRGNYYPSGDGGVVDKITGYMMGGFNAGHVEHGKLAIYKRTGLVFVFGTASFDLDQHNTASWYEIDISDTDIDASTDYYLLAWGERGGAFGDSFIYYDFGPAGNGRRQSLDFASAYPDPWAPTIFETRTFSIYATYATAPPAVEEQPRPGDTWFK